ncbi:MAG: tetratricopeptide repeat protein, partial [Anaerolineaceae bacterium]|nr:tetratricopeptide repeat protein [Anaerolineaceae bacterium]
LYEGALAFWRDTHNSVWQANVLNNLGVLQHLMGNYEAATSTLEKALQHARLSGYQRLEAFALAGIGDIYRDLDAIDEAGDVYNKALDIAQRIEEKYLIVYIHIAQAVITSLNFHFAIALAQLAEVEQAARDMQAAYEISLCQYEKAFILIRQKQYAEAVEILSGCLESFKKNGYAIQADRARYLLMASKCFLDQKDEAKALIRQIGAVENLTPLVWVASQLSGLFDSATGLRDEFRPLERIRKLVEAFQNRLPTLRRRIREKVSTVPFAPAKLTIRTLGRMQVKVNGKVITNALWQTQNARDLFFLLLIHPEGLTKEFIGLIFWPDASPEDVRFRFKNTVYRVRKATGKDTILLQDDYYRFNTTLDYEYDVENFNLAIEQAELTDDPDFKLNYLNMAVNIYKGQYLPELEDTWVIPEREHLRQVYQDATLQLAEIYMQQKKYKQSLDICMRILSEDPSLEEAYRISMRVHAAMGNTALVARQFERCVQVLADEIGVAPSPQTQNLYQTLLK